MTRAWQRLEAHAGHPVRRHFLHLLAWLDRGSYYAILLAMGRNTAGLLLLMVCAPWPWPGRGLRDRRAVGTADAETSLERGCTIFQRFSSYSS